MNTASTSVQYLTLGDIQSWGTGSFSQEELLTRLDSYGIVWYATHQGDLLVKTWQVAAEDFVPREQVAEIREGRSLPSDASALEWVSQHLSELEQSHAGQWIAVVSDQVVAASPSLPALTEQLARMDVGTPFITEIPSGPVVWDTAYARRII